MAGHAPHEILVYPKTVWLSVSKYSWMKRRQLWRLFKRSKDHPWWAGHCILTGEAARKATVPAESGVLEAFAWTVWPWDAPHRPNPNGTDLWVPSGVPNEYHIWYTQQSWEEFLAAGQQNWMYVGMGFYDPPGPGYASRLICAGMDYKCLRL